MPVLCYDHSLAQDLYDGVDGDVEYPATPVLCCDHSLAQNLFDGVDGDVEFVVVGIEVRRHADAGLGSEVHKNVALDKFGADFLCVRHVNRDRAPTALRIAWGVDLP